MEVAGPSVADPELLRRGRLIAWLSYNRLGARSLSELVDYVGKIDMKRIKSIPKSFGWCSCLPLVTGSGTLFSEFDSS